MLSLQSSNPDQFTLSFARSQIPYELLLVTINSLCFLFLHCTFFPVIDGSNFQTKFPQVFNFVWYLVGSNKRKKNDFQTYWFEKTKHFKASIHSCWLCKMIQMAESRWHLPLFRILFVLHMNLVRFELWLLEGFHLDQK